LRFLILIIIGCWLHLSEAQARSVLIKDIVSAPVGEHPEYYIDQQGNATLDQVMGMTLAEHPKANPSFGWSDNVVWLKSQFQKADDHPYILEVGYPLLDDLKIFLYRDGQFLKEIEAGDSIPSSQDIIDHIDPAFRFPQEPGLYTIVLRIKSSSSIQAPMKLYTPNSFTQKEGEEILITGIYAGILSIMALYNLFIFFASRSRAYLYYASFVLSFLLLQLSLSGHSYFYLWPAYPHLSDYMICQGGLAATIMMLFFAKDYLGVAKRGRLRQRLVQGLQYGLIAMLAVTFMLPYVVAIKMMALGALLAVLVVLGIAIMQTFEGQREARFYVGAWALFITGCVIYLLKQLGLLPVNFVTAYAFKIGSVIEVSLLSLALADRLNVMRSQLRKANTELQDLNENLEMRVVEKTRDIRSILDNLPQAIFQVKSRDGKTVIDEEYSRFLCQFLGKEHLEGQDPLQSIFASTNLSSNDLAMIDSVLTTSIGEDILQFEINEGALPREFMYQDKLLEVDWHPVADQNGVIIKILIAMKDVTEIRKLQMEAMQKAKEYRRLGEVSQHESQKMRDLLKVTQELLVSADKNIRPDINGLALAFRNLHTIKGLSRNFNFTDLTVETHDLEKKIKSAQGAPLSGNVINELKAGIKNLWAIFEDYRRINDEVLGRGRVNDKLLINRHELQAIHQKITQAKTSQEIKEIQSDILFLFEVKLSQAIQDEVQMLHSVCDTLKKPVPNVLFYNDDYAIPNDLKMPLRKVFVHLFRNSLDHGIEQPDERQAIGKPRKGTISVRIEESEADICIVYMDDGRGLALERIRQKAVDQQIIGSADVLEPQQIAELIFTPNLSTVNEVTDISGRGVGMDAVRGFIEEVGGRIEIHLNGTAVNGYVPFEIKIHLPYMEQDSSRPQAVGA
jgi:signal transduction histidine kinase